MYPLLKKNLTPGTDLAMSNFSNNIRIIYSYNAPPENILVILIPSNVSSSFYSLNLRTLHHPCCKYLFPLIQVREKVVILHGGVLHTLHTLRIQVLSDNLEPKIRYGVFLATGEIADIEKISANQAVSSASEPRVWVRLIAWYWITKTDTVCMDSINLLGQKIKWDMCSYFSFLR